MNLSDFIYSNYGIRTDCIPFGNGHINDTFASGGYIIQKINTAVFTEPVKLMENITAVTDYIREQLPENGPEKTLTVVKTLNKELCCTAPDGGVYRVCLLIGNTCSYDEVKPETLYKAAYGFGRFQQLLNGFDGKTLHETIKNFHNTPVRYAELRRAVRDNIAGRAAEVEGELRYIEAVKDELAIVQNAIDDGRLPVRVTHNDTKINNILLDKVSKEYVAVIDLDTVMPGSLLYDFGDALRSAANSAAEDEADLSRVGILYDNAEAFINGYLVCTGSIITPYERELMPFSVKLLALELGMRFLTDYLNGDCYFKITRPGQNLDRARCQLRFAQVAGENAGRLKEITDNAFGRING